MVSIEASNASPPRQVSQTSAPTDPTTTVATTTGEQIMATADMESLQSHNSQVMRSYLSSHSAAQSSEPIWSVCFEQQQANSSTDDCDNYALHSSPVMSSLNPATDRTSAQSSPRTWTTSPEQCNAINWEPAPEYTTLDPQFSYRPTSYPSRVPLVTSEEFHDIGRSHIETYPAGYYHNSPMDGAPPTPMSPCSSTLDLTAPDSIPSPPETAEDSDSRPASKDKIISSNSKSGHKKNQSGDIKNGSSTDGSGKKEDEPYAQLIYKAFLSTPRHAMTLQEIYQWFRENTDKGKDDSKGWQNSIRHNLSMNMAFTKRERRLSTSEDSKDGKDSASAKKSTEWYLEPWAVEQGVQSTTRYRKSNASRRNATLSSTASRSHHHHSSIYRHHAYLSTHPGSRKVVAATAATAGLLAAGSLGTSTRLRGSSPRSTPLRSNSTSAGSLAATAYHHQLQQIQHQQTQRYYQLLQQQHQLNAVHPVYVTRAAAAAGYFTRHDYEHQHHHETYHQQAHQQHQQYPTDPQLFPATPGPLTPEPSAFGGDGMLAMADIQAASINASGIVTTTVTTQGLPATPSPSPYHPLMYEGYASEHRVAEPWTAAVTSQSTQALAAVVTCEADTTNGTTVTTGGY